MIPFKGCTLTLYEHHRDAGIVHTFTNDGSPNNDNFASVGLANNVSSYECSCQWNIQAKIHIIGQMLQTMLFEL